MVLASTTADKCSMDEELQALLTCYECVDTVEQPVEQLSSPSLEVHTYANAFTKLQADA